eukprot:749509-Hanusia_phi.AAC.2
MVQSIHPSSGSLQRSRYLRQHLVSEKTSTRRAACSIKGPASCLLFSPLLSSSSQLPPLLPPLSSSSSLLLLLSPPFPRSYLSGLSSSCSQARTAHPSNSSYGPERIVTYYGASP